MGGCGSPHASPPPPALHPSPFTCELCPPTLQAGFLTYAYVTNFAAVAAELQASNDHRFRPKYRQWIVYSMCLRDHGHKHRWMGEGAGIGGAMGSAEKSYLHLALTCRAVPGPARPARAAFIDSDEFLVIGDGAPSLPALLADYEQYGGVAANWRILGWGECAACWGPACSQTHTHAHGCGMAMCRRHGHVHGRGMPPPRCPASALACRRRP